jgi:hypothetical protein
MDYYNSADGEIDILYTPKIDLASLTNPSLTFKMAKAPYSGYTDQLDVMASTDCGATWTTIWSKSDPALSTVAAITSAFTPTSGSVTQWRFETASLNAFVGQPEVLFAFKAISGYGNNMYIDDINVQNTTSIGDVQEQSIISVFPTITNGLVNIYLGDFSSTTKSVVSITDANGKVVDELDLNPAPSENLQLDFTSFQNGIYLVKIQSESGLISKKIVLQK